MKIFWLTFVAVTALFLAAVLAIQLPQVQTFLVRKVTDRLEGSIDGKLVFEKIHIKPFNALIIKNAAIIDREPAAEGADTLFKAQYVIARFTLGGLLDKEGLRIGRAYVTNACMTLVTEGYRANNLTRIFRIPLPDPDRPKKEGTVFRIRRASVNDMTFRLLNVMESRPEYAGHGINWNDLEVNDINIEARKLELTDNVMTGAVDYMTFTEKSGYICSSITGKATVGNGRSLIEEIRISDPWSELYIPEYSMSYDSPLDFSDYIGKIRMKGVIGKSSLDMKTLSYFAPGLSGISLKADISGTVTGTVSDLHFRDMSVNTKDSVILRFDGDMRGLPDIARTDITLDLHQLRCTSAGLEATVRSFSPYTELGIAGFAGNSVFRFRGHAKGLPDRIDVDMVASTGSGYAKADVKIENLLSGSESVRIEGNILSNNLDIGQIIGSRTIRQCSLRSGFSADLGTKDEGPELKIDTLFVDRLNLKGYDYGNIAAAGTMKKHAFDGRIICNDPNLNFMFQGVFSLSPRTQNSVYKFYANLGYADLNALNFDKRGPSKASLKATANFNRRQTGDLLGNMNISDIVLENGDGKYDIGDIDIKSYFGDDLYRMVLESSFADAFFSGSAQITEFVKDLKNVTLERELPGLFRDSVQVRTGNRYRLTYRGKNTMDLMAFLAPGLYVSDSTTVDMSVDTTGLFKAEIKSPRIALNENYIKDIVVTLNNSNGSLTGEITGKTMNIASIAIENNSLNLFANDNFIGFGYRYENPGDLINRGEVFITGDISRDEANDMNLHVEMLPSRVLLNSREWSIMPSSLDIRGKDLDVGKMEFTSGDQTIRVSGGLSGAGKDTLAVKMERFDISVINPLLKNRFGIEGAATGEARITSPAADRGLLFDFLVDSTRISGSDIGTLKVLSRWNEGTDRFDALVSNEIGGVRTFRLAGSYSPSTRNIEASAELDGTDISYARPFLSSIFSDMSGHLSGRIRASGPADALEITSENARIDDSELRIAFTNVPYNASGYFHLDDTGIHFDDISLSDRFGNTGRITGGIRYDKLKDIEFDTHISVSGMECLNLTENDNSQFYGNLSASGNLSITGPANSLKMNVTARTSGPGQLHIPIPSSATATTGNLLTFKQEYKEEYIDPYELMIRKIRTRKESSGNLGISLDVEATPETEAFIEIDKASGNILRGRGAGNIELDIDGDEFSILGDYTLTSGSYRFVAQGLAFRDFIISDGSSIKFNGDIMESDLDINATYRTKTSLATLIADTSSVSTRRTVDCGISITDKLKNPRLAFSIDIPDIDPTVKSRVESALSTEDKIQKQFISLIMFNSFLPDDQSGIVNNASVLYSTVTDIMYNQLNNIFQKLDLPVDLGFNYQPNERGNDMFDVAISTQLFNNRVVVNGNIGNRQYSSGTSNSDVVGDLDIEIKLDRPGLFRLNLFSHSADQYTNYLDDSQRNGIGLAYQREFNTFREFFRDLFTSRKKKQAKAAELREEENAQNKKTIIIGPDD